MIILFPTAAAALQLSLFRVDRWMMYVKLHLYPHARTHEIKTLPALRTTPNQLFYAGSMRYVHLPVGNIIAICVSVCVCVCVYTRSSSPKEK